METEKNFLERIKELHFPRLPAARIHLLYLVAVRICCLDTRGEDSTDGPLSSTWRLLYAGKGRAGGGAPAKGPDKFIFPSAERKMVRHRWQRVDVDGCLYRPPER